MKHIGETGLASMSNDELRKELLLFALATSGDADELVCIVGMGARVDSKNTTGKTPLHVAVLNGQLRCASALIHLGADVDAKDNGNATPMHEIAWSAKPTTAMLSLLIAKQCDVNAKNDHGNTPLHLSAVHGHLNIASALIEHGATVNATNDDGDTPLHSGSRTGNLEVVLAFIDEGCDLTAKNMKGRTPLGMASFHQKTEVELALIAHGADPSDASEKHKKLRERQAAVIGGFNSRLFKLLQGRASSDPADEPNSLIELALTKNRSGTTAILQSHVAMIAINSIGALSSEKICSKAIDSSLSSQMVVKAAAVRNAP